MEKNPRSPCTSVCKMDQRLMTEHGSLCAGCYRTIDEIAQWSTADAATQRGILNRIELRRQMLEGKRR